MRPSTRAPLLLAALLVLAAARSASPQAAVQGAGPSAGRPAQALSRAPRISTDLEDGTALVQEEFVFRVTVRDADGDPVSLTLLNPPLGLVFAPVVAATPPVTREVRWLNRAAIGGLQHLVFEARDHSPFAARSRLHVTLRVEGQNSRGAGTIVGDVTGDGVLDLVGRAPLENALGILDAGALYVWHGRAQPNATPDATLLDSAAKPGDQLAVTRSSGLQLADVTGDGILDVVAATADANVGTLNDVGSVKIWIGGPGLTGTLQPSASLSVPQPIAFQSVGDSSGQGISFADVTGDGILDVLAGSPHLLSTWRGAVYVLAGGPGLAGPTPPTATLLGPLSVSGGLGIGWQDFRVADLDGDGILDVVAVAPNHETPGPGFGALLFFRGGASMVGERQPQLLALPPTQGGWLGASPYDFADVTGDGAPDLVATAPFGSGGNGCVAVWAGGAGWQTAAPTALLTIANPETALFGGSLLLDDVSGDGVLDLVVGAYKATVGGVLEAGAIFVWAGGAGLSGTPAANAMLVRQDPQAGDLLGSPGGSRPLLSVDASGDGIRDVVVAAARATHPSIPGEAGGVFLFEGGPALAGTRTPWASLVPVQGDAVTNVALGAFGAARGVLLEDVTGDGQADLVVRDPDADVSGVNEAGALYVWAGGPGLAGTPAPRATLTAAAPKNRDRLGETDGQGVKLGDVTGDGIRDVVAGSELAERLGLDEAGALFVWAGGAGLEGAIAPGAELEAPTPLAFSQVGNATGEGFVLLDATGDGILDVVAATSEAQVAGVLSAGGVFLWRGGPALAGPGAILPADTTCTRASPVFQDHLGGATGRGFFFADLTGDGALDLCASAHEADVDGIGIDQGLLLFHAGPLPLGASFPLELRVGGNRAGAQLTR